MSQTPTDLITVSAETSATPHDVMAVLEDGWLYALWVVGASHIREVDPGWPKPGTRIHHAVGMWPLLIKDSTSATSYDPAGSLELIARGWPMGEAFIRLEVTGTATGSRITLGERVISGPGKAIRPLERLVVPPRNREALQRLIALAEGREHS
jgi:hypothetical protein